MTIPGNWDTSSAVSQISHGGGHACLVKDNKSLWCWGENGVNQSEESVSTNTSTVAVRTETGMRLWSEVTAGRAYTCGRQNDGTLMCRGYNIYGTLGDGTTKTRRSMTAVATGGQWRTVDAGEYHTCGIKTDDSLWCWGRNRAGEVGDGSGERKTSPVEIGQGQGWESVSAGQYHTCAIAQNGSLWCWGQNQGGQLGHGVMPLSSQPVETRRP